MAQMEMLIISHRVHGSRMLLVGGMKIQLDGIQYHSGRRLMDFGITSTLMVTWQQVSGLTVTG